MDTEPQAVVRRYAKRAEGGAYSRLRPEVLIEIHEREKVISDFLRKYLKKPIEQASLLEVGCGSGDNLLGFIRLGFLPNNVAGNELLNDRALLCRRRVPEDVKIFHGDASELGLAEQSFDIVYQSTVFTSLLDGAFQEKLAEKMWRWVKPGGGVLWYDFTWNNPVNPDVRGVPLSRIGELFPAGEIEVRRVTLAPPISRRVGGVWPPLITLLGAIPFLRTHVCCWIGKSQATL